MEILVLVKPLLIALFLYFLWIVWDVTTYYMGLSKEDLEKLLERKHLYIKDNRWWDQ